MVIAFISGLILGIIFFGGLWITVNKTLGKSYAALWFLGSAFLRTAVVLTGFYFVSQNSLPRLLLCVIGFIAGRFLVMRFTRKIDEKRLTSTEIEQP